MSLQKNIFSNISNLFIFSDEKYQLSKKKIIYTYIRYKLFSFGINGFSYTQWAENWYANLYFHITMDQIFILYLRTFPENTKCQSCIVLVNELKIGTQLCYNAPNFSYISENLSREYELSI